MTSIHPSAIVDPAAEIGDGVEIGPYCTVGPNVKLGSGTILKSHVVVGGHTEIGDETIIFPFASIGLEPQDLKFSGEVSALKIGKRNKIREQVTMNPGTEGGGLLTQVGDDCLFMVGAHVAHDCIVGNNCILANNATLAGHVVLEDYAIVGGLAAVHQFVRIGKHAMIGGMSGVEHDVIPYGSVMGDRANLNGLNIIGLKRRGYGKDEIQNLRAAYRMLFADEGTLIERVEDVSAHFGHGPAVQDVVSFIKQASSRGLTQPKTISHGE